ncbi:alkaline phosphatase family protein [Paraburkholderia youngii]|uniref:Putative AlkP superfamily pyrophosphatase or phosphodiesterase n=1 Tax=Paraburkholderia youngii TaxID=2782701 RepID=A0A7W8L833_9BURK|nr:alkaline phosphatase family protein [Paraburkholderia youngii]MBB5401733.1 putative AlkP superfamily pyrophosphatase or phosphodiesterase [Paraburkholderia youngii]
MSIPFRYALPSGLIAAAVLAACGSNDNSNPGTPAVASGIANAQHVLLVSIDGMHQQDLANCVAAKTCPNIAALAQTGVTYSSASTPGLSDSFPGLAALLTGGSPKTAGLFYDVSYDRTLYAPNDTQCAGPQGWNVVFDETTGIDAMNGGALTHLNGGGGFNPQAIPNAKVNGVCTPVYPHNYIKTNTLFEVVKSQMANARTAWADKHAWGYDWVNGPSGKGVDDLARTEINSIDPTTNSDYTDIYTHTEAFDNLHVQVILNQIDGKDSTGATTPGVPTVFGTNFQTLSVAQKATNASGGGYTDANFTPGPQVSAAIAYVDGAIGKMVTELKAKNLYASTVVVVTAKHGQSPSDHTKLVKNGDTLTALLEANNYLDANGKFGQFSTTSGSLNDGTGLVGTGMAQTDDVGLIWLRNPAQAAQVVATLQANLSCTSTGICADGPQASILTGAALVAKFGDPAQGRTPDIIVQPNPGVIYTSSTKKDAEHGGNAPDDSHVGLLVSYPTLQAATNTATVSLTQVAPTVLKSLALDPSLLHSVAAEGTQVLPGLGF